MKKIIVIGCPGSGKSTFSKSLHKITGIPLFHLDMMYWNKDGTTVEKPVFIKRLCDTLKLGEWIIDGNYSSTMELRLENCDTVIFLDYPTEVCISGIMERKGKVRSDMPFVEEGEYDKEFVDFIKNYTLQSKPQILQLLSKYPDKNVYIFTCREQANEFLEKLNR